MSPRPASALTLYPAIDLKGGACVRLRQGAMDQATVYSADPAAQARAWIDAGCHWLHVVDLDGATLGRSVNAPAIAAILAAATVPVQLGGGLRDLATIGRWLDAGVARAILGSAAVKHPALVAEACRTFPGRIAIGIDAREGMVAAEGWVETSAITALDLARALRGVGCGGDHPHRHRARRDADRRQRRGDSGARGGALDAGDRERRDRQPR